MTCWNCLFGTDEINFQMREHFAFLPVSVLSRVSLNGFRFGLDIFNPREYILLEK